MNVRSAAARPEVSVSVRSEPAIRAVTDLAAQRVRDARRRQLTVQGLRVLTAVVWLGSWELTTRLGWVDKFFFAQPSEIAVKLWVWTTQGTALGRNRLLSDVLSPYIKGANAIPRVVVGALFAISLGLDIKSKVATAAILVFFVVFFNAFQGVREVDRNLVANARILGAGNRQL